MSSVIIWWSVITLLGAMAFPYVFPLLKHLPDRGYSIAKTFGLLTVGYALWVAGSLRLLPNSRGAIILLVFGLALGAAYLWSRQRDGILEFVKGNRRLLLMEECVFASAFVLWAIIRAYNPQIEATEKPMDFAFLNSAIRSQYFPPLDPWLSGHTISYYYLGYLVFGSVIQLTATPSAVGYNLALALAFALASLGVFGILYNLAKLAFPSVSRSLGLPTPYAAAVTGVALVLGAGNLEVLLELARAHGLGDAGFWQWLGIRNLDTPYQSARWYPTDNWWWWRATRVIGTTDEGKVLDDTITEFPFFSFLLGDLHPHVMALPFAVASLALALDVLAGPRPLGAWVIRERTPYVIGVALLIGSLGPMNAWDLPTYLAVYLVAVLISHIKLYGFAIRQQLPDLLYFGAAVLGLAFLLFLPFYLGTGLGLLKVLDPGSPDASLLPLALWRGPYSRPVHLVIFWGPFLFLAGSYIISRARAAPDGKPLLLLAAAVPAALLIVSELALSEAGNATAVGFLRMGQQWWAVLPALGLAWLLLFRQTTPIPLLARAAVAHPFAGPGRPEASPEVEATSSKVEAGQGGAGGQASSVAFVELLVFLALLLIALCETVYIKDVFHNRMNTVFKLYYQAWVLLGLASVFVIYYLYHSWQAAGVWWKMAKMAWLAALALLLLSVSLYPVASLIDKTVSFSRSPTLNGVAFVWASAPEEAEAIQWLKGLSGSPVVLEATGDQYSQFGRVSSRTGLPTVLGWQGHELQWRGSDSMFRERPQDIDAIYRAPDKRQVMPLLRKYNISYVFVGALERSKYPLEALNAFRDRMTVTFQNAGAAVYRVPQDG